MTLTLHVKNEYAVCADCPRKFQINDDAFWVDDHMGRIVCATCAKNSEYAGSGL